jgi:hypothetical protein
VWKSYPTDPDDPIDFDYQTTSTAAGKKLRAAHNKAFAFIRSNLNEEIFATTTGLTRSVPRLLRHLRDYWHGHTVEDRAEMREEYNEMQLEQYHDMDAYIIGFKVLVNTMREYDVGSATKDEDVLFQFEKGLPTAYDSIKTTHLAQNIDLHAAYLYCTATAKRDETLPGHISPGWF